MTSELDHEALREMIRLIGEGKNWDALEILRRELDDNALLHAVDLAQFQCEVPW